MAHPYGVARSDRPYAFEQWRLPGNVDLGASEFALAAGFDPAAQLADHRLLAVADAEHGNAQLDHLLRRPWAPRVADACGPAGKNDRPRHTFFQRRFRLVEGHDFAIDAAFAHAPHDQLRHLRAEI